MSNKKKKFREIHGKTRVGKFLQEKAPKLLGTLLNVAGDFVPGGGVFKQVVGGLINESEELTQDKKEMALKALEKDIIEMQEVTKRWEADAHSDSWLSKNIRPMVLGYLILCATIVMILDSAYKEFEVKEHWVTLLTSLLITTVGAYFGLREFGKFASKKYK